MARELNQDFIEPRQEGVSIEDVKELKKEVLELGLQAKKSQGGVVFIYSKLVRLFDTIKSQMDRMRKEHADFQIHIQGQLEKLQNKIEEQKDNQEQFMTLKIKELINEHHQLNKKYDYQLKDLCRSLTEQSEQMWSLNDQLQEIKEEISPRTS